MSEILLKEKLIQLYEKLLLQEPERGPMMFLAAPDSGTSWLENATVTIPDPNNPGGTKTVHFTDSGIAFAKWCISSAHIEKHGVKLPAYIHWKEKNPDVPWTAWYEEILKHFGVGPIKDYNKQILEKDEKTTGAEQWHSHAKTYLEISELNQHYYVSPVVYETMNSHPKVVPFIDSESGHLQINTLLKNKTFLEEATKASLTRLGRDLDKAISDDALNSAPWFGFLPADKVSHSSQVDGKGEPIKEVAAQSWYVTPRPKEAQALWLKVMFDRNWIETLPPKKNPSFTSPPVREVMIPTKDFKKNLNILKQVLRQLHKQYLESQAIEQIEVPGFQAECFADKVDVIYDKVNQLMLDNKKPPIEDLTSGEAIQFGFSEDYKLQYIAYSEQADCLCDAENINAYTLNKNFTKLKWTMPFENQTMNGFVHLLPDIARAYGKKIAVSGNPEKQETKGSLFSSQESWLHFINKYVYPPPEIGYLAVPHETAAAMHYQQVLGILKNPIWGTVGSAIAGKGFKLDRYIKDPFEVLSPQAKSAFVGATQGLTQWQGDDALLRALHSDITDITSLFDRFLNKVSIEEVAIMVFNIVMGCLGIDGKKHICDWILKTQPLSISELRIVLYPCLREHPNGDAAIAMLESKVTGRMNSVYDIAKARFPEKFQSDEKSVELADITKLYCADPYMQKVLGRSPDDFNEEIMQTMQELADEAFCDCLIKLYGPMVELFQQAQELYNELVDEVGNRRPNVKSIQQQATLSIDRMIAPIRAWGKSRNKMEGFLKVLGNLLYDMVMAIIYSTVTILLKYVKDQILGSMSGDLCMFGRDGTDSIFGKGSFRNFLESNPLYEDRSQAEFEKILKGFDLSNIWNADIKGLMNLFDKWDESFSPREKRRLLNTPCGDSSADDLFEKQLTMSFSVMDPKTLEAILTQFPGHPVGDIVGAAKNDPSLLPDANLEHAPSAATLQGFMNYFNKFCDQSIIDDLIEDHDKARRRFTEFCLTPNVGPELLNSLDRKEVEKLAKTDVDKLKEDLEATFPFLDMTSFEDMLPPLFCGPCSPRQVGQAPLMEQQTVPNQDAMMEKFQSGIYSSIDNLFNSNITVYKPIVQDIGKPKFQNDLKAALKVQGGSFESGKEAIDGYEAAFEKLLNEASTNPALDPTGKVVADKLRKKINNAIKDTNFSTQLKDFDWDKKWAVYAYPIETDSIESSLHNLYLIYNFSDEIIKWNTPVKAGQGTGLVIRVRPKRIKVVVVNNNQSIVAEWPSFDQNSAPEETDFLKDFDLEDVGSMLAHYLDTNSYGSKELNNLIKENDDYVNLFKSAFPYASSYIFETVFSRGADNDLFLATNFQKIPLTNEEARLSCKNVAGAAPLLGVDEIKEDIADAKKDLQCVVGMFETPDASQIANAYGLYKTLIKVCIVEEYLKNIFLFAFVRVQDILEIDAYMNLVVENVRRAVEIVDTAGGYKNLLFYSEKIVNGRKQTEDINLITAEISQDDIEPKLTSEQCLKFLIKEIAIEINDLLDSRIQDYVDQDWKKTFNKIDNLNADEGFSAAATMSKYAIIPQEMDFSLYPHRERHQGDWKISNENELPFFARTRPAGTGNSIEKEDVENPLFPIPSSDKWNGGLFFQPYVRMESKLDNSSTDYFENFFSTFREAFFLKVRAEFPNWDDDIALPFFPTHPWLPSGEVAEKQSFPPGIFTNDGFKQDTIFEMYKFIHEKIIIPIDNDIATHGKSFYEQSPFEDFFLLFFSPLSKSGDLGDEPIDWAPHKAPFQRVVSSFVNEKPPKLSVNDGQGGYNIGPLDADGNSNNLFAGKFNWHADAFYYWEGALVENMTLNKGYYNWGVWTDARYNFINRGVVSIEDVCLGGNIAQEIEGITYETNHPVSGAPREFKNTPQSFPSTISTIADSRNTPLGFGVEVEALINENPNLGSEVVDPVTGMPYNFFKVGDMDWLKPVRGSTISSNFKGINKFGFLSAVFDYMKEKDYPWPQDIEKDEKPGTNAQITQLHKLMTDPQLENYRHASLFYYLLKEIVIGAPFDLWFDFSLEMRLNLVIPFENTNSGPGDEMMKVVQNMRNTLKTAFAESDHAWQIDKKYVQDNMFLLSAPKKGDDPSFEHEHKWMCLPIEHVEYDLAHYWTQQIPASTGTKAAAPWVHLPSNVLEIITEADAVGWKGPDLEVIFKEATEPPTDTDPHNIKALKRNPWTKVMAGITSLGSRDRDDFGIIYPQPTHNTYFKSTFGTDNYQPHKAFSIANALCNFGSGLSYSQTTLGGLDFQGGYYNVPSLWSVCKLLNHSFSNNRLSAKNIEVSKEDNPYKTPLYRPSWDYMLEKNHIKEEVYTLLKANIIGKLSKNPLIEEILPVKEQLITTSFIYRYLMSDAYPKLDDIFEPSKKSICRFIEAMSASFNQDYDYLDPFAASPDLPEEEQLPTDPGSIGGLFMKLVVQMAANMVDPTWKTPWFFPGPLTPVGAIAKAISQSDDDDPQEALEEGSTILEEECEPPPEQEE